MWVPPIIQAICFSLAGKVAASTPKILSGYDLLPKRWRESTDLEALGRFSARLLYLCAVVSLLALATMRHETAYAIALCSPLPILLVGWGWYLRKYKTTKK